VQGLIFVVDSNDKDRIAEARDELHKLLQNSELSKAKVLVFANKQDLSNVLSPTEVTEKLYLGRLAQKVWYVRACSATTGEGLHEGLDWLAAALKEKNGVK
jgi:ADP-ribosylation factor protein 1